MNNPSIATVLLCASTFGLATAASAGETFLLLEDTYDLHPPYAQWWLATPSDDGPETMYGTHEVFIRGDGKRGDFFGILAVNCPDPNSSEWLATGGYLSPEDVPSRAIINLRLEICSHGDPV